MKAILRILLAGLLLGVPLTACASRGSSQTAGAQSTNTQSAGAPAQTARPSTDPTSGLPYIERAALPPEGQRTLASIERGGPFKYSRDGVVFGNREQILPRQARGYYHEYTVPTPGSRDRGARRIVCGPPPECYYSDDHYASFRRIRP